MSAHTAVPWAVHNKVRAIVPLGDVDKIVPLVEVDCLPSEVANTIALFADPRAGMSRRETYANAAFIVRACNNHDALLEALEGLFRSYKQLADSGDAGNWRLEDKPEGANALAAIAAATDAGS